MLPAVTEPVLAMLSVAERAAAVPGEAGRCQCAIFWLLVTAPMVMGCLLLHAGVSAYAVPTG